MPDTRTEDSTTTAPDLPVLLAGADHTDLCRTVLAVAAMHEPDRTGRCRYCRAERRHPRLAWWHRPAGRTCQTRRVIVAELRTNGRTRWTPA